MAHHTVHSIVRRAAVVLATLVAVMACTLDKKSAPSLTGPSEFGLSFSLTATPDVLTPNGASLSKIVISARDAQSKPPTRPQQFLLTASSGTLSVTSVATDADGNATAYLTAPATGVASQIVVSATSVGNDAINSQTRTVMIRLGGPAPSFAYLPAAPGQFDGVRFDASQTTLNGAICQEGTCSYRWDFGDGTTGDGRTVTHGFVSQGVFTVTLTVADASGVAAQVTRSISVGAQRPLTVDMTLSPPDPKQGQAVRFDASGSTSPDGSTITAWAWDFGNGDSATTQIATTTFANVQGYTVRLTITDGRGRTGTATKVVTVKAP